MTSNIGTTTKLAETVSVNLKTDSAKEKTAAKIAENLSKLEEQLMSLYSKPDADGKYDEKQIAEKQLKYQRSMRAYEAFQQLMKNAHEIVMRGIQNLRIS